MKKSYFIIIAVVALFITTGCLSSGNKRLVCKQNASGVDVTFNIDFKGNMIDKMDFSYDVDMSSRDQSTIDLIAKQDFCAPIAIEEILFFFTVHLLNLTFLKKWE